MSSAMAVALVGYGWITGDHVVEYGFGVEVQVDADAAVIDETIVSEEGIDVEVASGRAPVELGPLAGAAVVDPADGWRSTFAWVMASAVAAYAAAALVLWNLRRLVDAVAAGTPFEDRAPRRLEIIGLVVIGAQIVDSVLEGMTAKSLAIESRNLFIQPLEPSVNLTVIGLGLLIVVLGQVFRYGRQLADEQALTV